MDGLVNARRNLHYHKGFACTTPRKECTEYGEALAEGVAAQYSISIEQARLSVMKDGYRVRYKPGQVTEP